MSGLRDVINRIVGRPGVSGMYEWSNDSIVATGRATVNRPCDPKLRGGMRWRRGGSGEADVLEFCRKDATGEYHWSMAGGHPPGVVVAYAGDDPPPGTLACDGSAYDRDEYAALFAAIGTKFGVGDGSTTFNVPNLEGRVIVGIDPNDADFDAVGKTAGAKTVTLTAAQSGLPAHTHIYERAVANIVSNTAVGGAQNRVNAINTPGTNTSPAGGTDAGEAHLNVQPSLVMKYAIYY